MLEFSLVSNNQNCAIFGLKIIKNKSITPSIISLIDTGASFPVWVDGLDTFLANFPNSKSANAETLIRGFGNGFVIAPIYIIPKFVLSDGVNSITYLDLPIAIMKKDYSFNMVISFTMINKLNYSFISYTNRKQIKPIRPILRIYNYNTIYHVGFKKSLVSECVHKKYSSYFSSPYIIEAIYIFNQ